jgi:hypothetical protein
MHDATAATAAPNSSAGKGGRSRSCMIPVWAANKATTLTPAGRTSSA